MNKATRANSQTKHATFLSHGREPEVIVPCARTVVSPRVLKLIVSNRVKLLSNIFIWLVFLADETRSLIGLQQLNARALISRNAHDYRLCKLGLSSLEPFY